MINVVDEFTPECLAIRMARKLKGADVIAVLSDLFILRGLREDLAVGMFGRPSSAGTPRR